MNRQTFADLARALKPQLFHTLHTPLARVTPAADPSAWQGWAMQMQSGPLAGVTLAPGESICWDFGQHLTGFMTLKLALHGTRQDAPVRIRLRMGEMPHEIARGPESYTGWISAAWLQQEILVIDQLPCSITLPRRYALRYLQLTQPV